MFVRYTRIMPSHVVEQSRKYGRETLIVRKLAVVATDDSKAMELSE